MLNTRNTSRPIEWDLSKQTFNEEEAYIYLDLSDNRFYSSSNMDELAYRLDDRFKLTTNPLLESDAVKYLIILKHQFFHTIHESFALILKLHSLDPSAVLILYHPSPAHSESKESSDSTKKIYRYLEELLIDTNVPYVMLHPFGQDPERGTGGVSSVIKVAKYIDMGKSVLKNNFHLSLDDYLTTSKAVLSHVGASESAPYRRIYLSRSHIDDRFFDLRPGEVGYADDKRMNDQHILERYFESKGYEIVVPERQFPTFKEQIQYMQSVKVIASITSSGISNSLFMQDGQFVLEIVAELVTRGRNSGSDQMLFDDYMHDSYMKKHTHVRVPSRRDPSEVVASLDALMGALP